MSVFEVSYFILWLVVILQSVCLVRLLRPKNETHKGLIRQDHGLPMGSMFPQFNEIIDSNSPDKSVGGAIVLFTMTFCDVCKELYIELSKFKIKYPDLRIVLLMRGNIEDINRLVKEYNINIPVKTLSESETEIYKTTIAPFGYYLSVEGHILSKSVTGSYEHLQLLASEGRRGA
jgi:hypothetical protein